MNRIDKARRAGEINRGAIEYGFSIAESGLSLLELDKYLEHYITEHGGTPAFKGYKGFSGASCLSVNNVAVHGIPNEYILSEDDILTIDIGTIYDGIYADSARTEAVNSTRVLQNAIIGHTYSILISQMNILRAGTTLLDIAEAGEESLRISQKFLSDLKLVESLGGHYIGEKLHMDPFIPNTLDYRKGGLSVEIQKKRYREHILRADDIICIEPVTTLGPTTLTIDPDGWSCRTQGTSAHFENTILITPTGFEILT